MTKIILASASKRRSGILNSCGIRHKVVVTNAEEIVDQKYSVRQMVAINAAAKADLAAIRAKDGIIIAADTLVAHGKEIMGKPKDESDAKRMLAQFSGNRIEVYTGLCVYDIKTKKRAQAVDKSEIIVANISKKDIGKYFHHLGPYDKAGGFSVEGVGSMIFDNIHGSYFNILGLPMMKLRELFEEIGLDLADFVCKKA